MPYWGRGSAAQAGFMAQDFPRLEPLRTVMESRLLTAILDNRGSRRRYVLQRRRADYRA